MGESGRVCKVCLNTDFALAFDPSRWKTNGPDGKPLKYLDDRNIEHHPSIASLRASALQGCPTCLFFMEVLGQPLRLQEPEPWGKHEAIDSKKRKKAAKRQFDAARSHEEKLGPCVISAIGVRHIHQDLFPSDGAVAGFWYGSRGSARNSYKAVGVIASDSSPKSIGTRNLLNYTDTGLCREWLKQCQSEHHDCPPVSECNLPTRLIDVGEPSNYAQPRLVETRGQRGQYVTLSHCWGTSKPPSTTKANLSSRLSSIPLDSMPKTFRDAINIVRVLGYRYIWIDSYCIVQDDDTDWHRECATMAAVYSNCVVTLAAPFASDCHAGFSRGLHPIPAERWCDIPVHWPGATIPDQLRVIHPYDRFCGRVDWDESPLAKRAWVLQEHLLSPRWLYFGKDSLYFECPTAKFDEHLRVPLVLSKVIVGTYWDTPKDVLSFTTYEDGLKKWYDMIRTYSNLCLTSESDRLPALSGIASRFATKLGDEYIAGIWRRDLAFGLIFKVADPDSASRSMNPSSIPGPSWSWYSCDRRVEPLCSNHNRFTVKSSHGTYDRALFDSWICFGPLIEVISLSATPLGTNSFGAVRDAKLTVMGRLQSVWYSHGKVHSNEDGKVFGELSQDVAGTFEWDRTTKVFMLPIAICGNWVDDWDHARSWHALALKEVLSEPKTYLRIGLIHKLKYESREAFDSEDSPRWRVWKFLFTPELQQLHLV
jgi:hypothetical protein